MERSPRYLADVVLSDGSIARIRSVGPDDRRDLASLFADSSDTNYYRRFFSVNRHAAITFVDRLCAADRPGRDLVATIGGRVVGVASVDEISADEAEISLFVADDVHSHGLGTLLLEHATALQRARGVRELFAEVLAENSPMLRLFSAAGFEITTKRDSSVVEVTLKTELSDAAAESAGLRERLAERASLQPMLEPAAVAVVGVGRGGGVGRAVVEKIRASGYGGRLYAVNRHPTTVDGIPTVAALAEIHDRLDLVVVAVPAAGVEAVVRDAADVHAKAVVVLSTGFAEIGDDGLEAELRLADIARDAGMRLVGPNCLGVISNLRDTRLDATFSRQVTQPGSLAVATQSGGVGIGLVDELAARRVGLAALVSLGNKADVSGNDLLCAWTDDPDIRAVGLYLESFGNPRKFLDVARSCSVRKPIIAEFGGRSEAGHRAGASHTAGSLSSDRFLRALCESTGVIPVESARAFVGTADLLLNQPLPRGSRLGIVGNAGGLGVLAADAAERAGLSVPPVTIDGEQPDADTRSGLVPNPLDLGAGADVTSFRDAVRCVLTSGQIDSLLVVVAATSVTDLDGIVAAASEVVSTTDQAIACAIVVVGARPADSDLTSFDDVDEAVDAIAAAATYQRWRERNTSGSASHANPLRREIRTRLQQILESSGDGTSLPVGDTLEILESLGVPVPAWCLISGPDDARSAVASVGLPAVAKAARPGLVHKTDQGLVVRDLADPAAVEAAARRLAARSGSDSVLLQAQVATGAELALGIVDEPNAGPLVMIATGGVDIDVWADQVFLVPPLTPDRVLRALRTLRSWPLLHGFRGRPAADVDEFIRVAMMVSDLAIGAPEVRELDLNPVIVGADGVNCVDATIVLQAAPLNLEGAPSLRRRRND